MVRYLFLSIAIQASVPPPPPPPPILCDPFYLFFDAGSARLTAGSQRMIGNIVSVKDLMKPPIRVVGYADAPGSERYNLTLSLRRAKAVRAALIAKGVPADWIIVGARGETNFLVETDAAEGQNRRVQVSECERL
jgi:OmpA-OmpF porin, OOP family